MTRDILHIRLDAFFATVEQRRRPNLRGRPIIVTEPKGNTSGVVVSASREARRQGVKEAMSVRHAQRACPDALLFKADYPAYRLVFDEFLHMLSQLHSPAGAGLARQRVYGRHRRPQSVRGPIGTVRADNIRDFGIGWTCRSASDCAPNKLLARIASGKGKWFIRVRPGCESDFLAPLPVSVLDAVDSKIDKRLGELGVSNIGELAQVSERVLVRQFGPIGNVIHKQAQRHRFQPG